MDGFRLRPDEPGGLKVGPCDGEFSGTITLANGRSPRTRSWPFVMCPVRKAGHGRSRTGHRVGGGRSGEDLPRGPIGRLKGSVPRSFGTDSRPPGRRRTRSRSRLSPGSASSARQVSRIGHDVHDDRRPAQYPGDPRCGRGSCLRIRRLAGRRNIPQAGPAKVQAKGPEKRSAAVVVPVPDGVVTK